MGNEFDEQNTEKMRNPFVTVHSSAASAASSGLAARVGKLILPNRKPIRTPHYITITSRGTVPHISPDIVRNSTAIGSLYVGLEDFLDKAPRTIPILNIPQSHPRESRLRKFIAAQDDDVLILASRRAQPVVTPQANTPNSITILTSAGSYILEHAKWLETIQELRPDIVIGFADLTPGHVPGVKRRAKMVDRTHAYTRDATHYLYGESDSSSCNNMDDTSLYFAPILPLENTQQSLYLDDLEDELRPKISGLALYESASLSIIPDTLSDLARFCIGEPWVPQEILRDIALGADLFTIPFIGDLSNAGIALEFVFTPSSLTNTATNVTSKPLAFDLWDKSYSTDLTSISEGCECYACRKHHRAYIHHLLSAKEMLAWSLLQIHNHHVMDRFFEAVRESITNNTLEADIASFEREYESAFPKQTGQGPRVRGYSSYVSKTGEPRRNEPAYGRLNDALEKYAESQQSSVATPDTNAEGLERQGFAEKSG
ncbi:tRNA-guanine transglycosylase family protein [Talaromyces stipitatus ATCC 10500]|uniref:Queuine tRNA-ribosyltransferase accessory subunit 2 n=1 Tax=Talaromyces stipitatus (strain ATCC 10500 / CBS 375.48 / QM 6759 / NRRL 1006) TaxID=441959 RepID=B8MDD3_TALSN|nr:tRNA-guanine transglycosylase family protein [Talaromyces stipitatus ATCC 10500]EED17896.1 tRNA-guanine transglycosylase family protein [Talaromyces stipitatus ATCC 10500]